MPHLPLIAIDAADAFMAGYSFSRNNTVVNPPMLQVHGRTIATLHDRETRQAMITVAGHPTRTTVTRLNAVLQRMAIPASIHLNHGSAFIQMRGAAARHDGYPFLSDDDTYLIGPDGIQGP